MQIDDIARFQVSRHRLAANAGKADLTLRVVRIDEDTSSEICP